MRPGSVLLSPPRFSVPQLHQLPRRRRLGLSRLEISSHFGKINGGGDYDVLVLKKSLPDLQRLVHPLLYILLD
jgi:hypothetical protein